MINYSLVPVDHQPNFENYSLVPVDYDPFIDDDVAQQMRSQQAQAPQQPESGIAQPSGGIPVNNAGLASYPDATSVAGSGQPYGSSVGLSFYKPHGDRSIHLAQASPVQVASQQPATVEQTKVGMPTNSMQV